MNQSLTRTMAIDWSPTAPLKYAKLAPPRVHDALPRQRLFTLVDKLRQKHAVIWISSPPGAGKTTLAASYLAQLGQPAIWCQIDQGDADPATLFYFLTETTRDAGPILPWRRSEPEPDTPHFERLFFRDYYARLPRGTVVVLDNIHEFDWSNSGELLECAFNEVPDGITVMALSRDSPPARLARMELGGRLTTIGWDELRLDREEARALAQSGDSDDTNSRDWLDLVDGWAAGIIMLRNFSQGSNHSAAPLLKGRDAVFRYFAGEILERMPSTSQHLLLLLSCLPGMSVADAELLTGEPAAAPLLDQFYRNRLFVERRGTESLTYHFHALFREFLQHEARQRLDTDERTTLLERAASILDSQGRTDEAAQLYQDAAAHPALARLLLRRAAGMLATGRSQTWREWMSWLPPAVVEAEPWLWYWHGVSLNHVAPLRGRKILIRAEQAFHNAGNVRARLLTIAAIVDSYDFEWADFSALPHWIEQILQGLSSFDLSTLEPELDLKLHSRLIIGLLFIAPDSPILASSAQRALQTLSQVDNPVEQLTAGANLLRYFDWMDNTDTANWLVTELSKLADDPAISPFHRVWWYGRVARWYNKDGNYQEAQQTTGTAKRIVANFDLDPLLFQFLEVHHLLGTGDLGAARSLLDQIRQTLSPIRKFDLVELNSLEANWRSLSGDIDGAIEVALEAVQMCVNAGLPIAERARFEGFLAACYALTGKFEVSGSLYDQATANAYGYDILLTKEARQFVEAYAYSISGDEQRAAEILRVTFGAHRHRQATTLFVMIPGLASKLAVLALRNGIEVEHVRAIIARQRLIAPHRFTQNWPWPVAVRTLGKFELLLNGVAVTASGKTQQRPLMLLKALVAAGDTGRTQQALVVQLWPDVDAAKSALNVTVHRLRKLLQNDDAIAVISGKVQLAKAKVWSDLAALADVCSRIDNLPANITTIEVKRLTVELLDLYRGPFCGGDEENWVLAARESSRNRFLTAVVRLGHCLETLSDWATAISLYQRSLEAEPLAEISYRGLMRCAHAQNDSAAAFSAYRRCRETLSIVLGLQPSAETEKLAKSLGLK